MTSLRQLLATHETALIIDAAASCIQAGWMRQGGEARWATANEEAGTGVFQCVQMLDINVESVGAFVYCHGPGSILGIRTSAMALRTWTLLKPRPVYAYCSLALVAHALGRDDVSVIADARRDSWHQYRTGGPLRRVATTELEGALVMPENFRHWSTLPGAVSLVPYSISDLLPQTEQHDLFEPTEAPDAFLHEEPSYVTWTPKIHRAPAPS